MENEKITNESLAETIKILIAKVDEQTQTSNKRHYELQADMEDLKKGQFTEDEKTDLMSMVRYGNQRMENEALGKKDITLEREEYDATALGRGFKNRFKAA